MNRIKYGTAVIDFLAGTDIMQACQQAREIAEAIHGVVSFTHNGIDMSVNETDKPSSLVKRYDSRVEYAELVRKLR